MVKKKSIPRWRLYAKNFNSKSERLLNQLRRACSGNTTKE
jgi:hypothetical protein